jgi:hypothetical protein
MENNTKWCQQYDNTNIDLTDLLDLVKADALCHAAMLCVEVARNLEASEKLNPEPVLRLMAERLKQEADNLTKLWAERLKQEQEARKLTKP